MAWPGLLGLFILLAALVASAAARLFKVPYVVGLVLAGLLIGILHRPPPVFVPSVILSVFLPALLFAAAWEMDLDMLARQWVPIAALATVGVALGIGVTYAVLAGAAGIAGVVALTFGALVAATDPIAVIALFREMDVESSLRTVVEGESLLNDGVAVVLVASIVAGSGGSGTTFALRPGVIAVSAVWITAAGAALGAFIGLVSGFALRWTAKFGNHDARKGGPVIRIVVTCLAAYGSYGIAQAAHVSGIVAVIAAGLASAAVRGSVRSAALTNAQTDRFWELAAFVANTILFVLVGLSIDLRSLASLAGVCTLAALAAVVSRIVSSYGVFAALRLVGVRMPLARQHIVALGGMRGALSMALALSLPLAFPGRSSLIAMVYAVVLFTLVIQGLSLRPALAALALTRREPDKSGANHERKGAHRLLR